MNVKYLEDSKTLSILDDEKRQIILMKIGCFTTLFQGLLGLEDVYSGQIDFSTYIRFSLIAIAFMLGFFLVKRTSRSDLKIDEIAQLRERSSFGVSGFSFLLKNGKIRQLSKIRGKYATDSLYALCAEHRIPIRK